MKHNTNLIGISGKLNSGKDTVAAIIQFLTAEDRSAVCEDLLKNGRSIQGHHNSRYEIKKFAGKLKTIASLLTGIPVEKFEDQEFKKEYLGEEWSVHVWNDPDPIEDNDYRITSRVQYEGDTSLITYNEGYSEAEVFDDEIEEIPMTVRELLQKLGTEAMREGLHRNVWVNALFADYRPIKLSQDDPSYWLVTDTRFPNEAEAITERGGILLRIERPGASTGDHPSETALDDYPFEHVIMNDGDLNDLINKVRYFLTQQNII